MEKIKEQFEKEQARKIELEEKLKTLVPQNKMDFSGERFEQIIGYKEEIFVINQNSLAYRAFFDNKEKAFFEKRKVELLKLQKEKETQKTQAETVLNKFEEKFPGYVERDLTNEENKAYKELDDSNFKLVLIRALYRTILLILREGYES